MSKEFTMSDNVKGSFYGLAIGDALGVPHEFARFVPKITYTGIIQLVTGTVRFQWHSLTFPPGSCSDDTRMSMTLYRTLRKNNMKYIRDDVILAYMDWANHEDMLGANTRALLKGVKTINGYTKRMEKISDEKKETMQSNGSLMRCSPLALIENEEECLAAVVTDVYITNPNEVNLTASLFYVKFLRKIYAGKSKESLMKFTKRTIKGMKGNEKLQQLRTYLKKAIKRERIELVTNKGHVINALYIAVYTFFAYDTYQDAIDYVIRDNPGSDTDSNGAITGALMGAYIGFDKMTLEEKTAQNIKNVDFDIPS